MSEFKAIQTEYKRYLFRSRLEARWAVFFDAMGIEWEYEPEGIVLSDGTNYLPDFYLPHFHCYFEVKRRSIKGTPEEERVISKISNGEYTDSWAGMICFGDPMDDDLYIFCQEMDDGGGGSYENPVTIGFHPETHEPYLFAYNDRRDRTFFTHFGEDMEDSYIPMVTYDAVKDELTYNGNLVRWFEDYYPIGNNETAGIDFLNENGTVDVYAVRDLESFSKAADSSVDPAGKLIGLKEFTQQEFDARDIEALKNSTSVAMAGTPLEDSETAKLVAEYEAFGVTYDAEKDQWYFNGEEVRYFRDVLTSNGESLTSGKFRGEMRTLGSGVGTIDIYTVRDYGHLNSEHHGTLTGIEKYSQEEFDEHTQAGISGNQSIGNASHN